MKTVTEEELKEALRLHELWNKCDSRGVIAKFRNVNLHEVDFSRCMLAHLTITNSILTDAQLVESSYIAANFTDSNLQGANCNSSSFIGAILTGVNLTNVSLWNTIGNGEEIKSLQLEGWPIAYTAENLQIGCENHKINDWWEFSDCEISEMDDDDDDALEWWYKYKDHIRKTIELSPATPTGHEQECL